MGGLSSRESDEEDPATGECRRKLVKTVMVIRHECRAYFGVSFADKWGFWVDHHLSSKIHRFGDWIDYPRGDRELGGHKDSIRCARLTRDGHYLFSGARNGEIIKWDLLKNQMITQFKAHSGAVNDLECAMGIVVSAGMEGTIKIWNGDDCSLIRIMNVYSRGVSSVSLNKRGTTLVSGSLDKICRLWSVKNGKCLRVIKGHSKFVSRVLFAGDLIISGSGDKSLRIWDPKSGKELRKTTDGIGDSIYDISLNCDSTLLVCCYFGGYTVFKYPSMEIIRTVSSDTQYSCFHPSKPTILAVEESEGSYTIIKVYRTETFRLTHMIKERGIGLSSLQFSPDGSRLITVCDDHIIRNWEVSRHKF